MENFHLIVISEGELFEISHSIGGGKIIVRSTGTSINIKLGETDDSNCQATVNSDGDLYLEIADSNECGSTRGVHNDMLQLRNKIIISDLDGEEITSINIGLDQQLLGTVSEVIHLETIGQI